MNLLFKKKIAASNYAAKVAAAKQMKQAFNKIVEYKKELGIEISPEDTEHTGLIGFNTSTFTTSRGSLNAKKTTSHTDMAAMAVEYLTRAGVKPGDYAGLHLSGSFPGLNIAALSACEQMGVKIKIIASAGSSNYGANDRRLTFPDMLIRLIKDGIFEDNLVALSLGGQGDVASELESEERDDLISRFNGYSVQFIFESDLQTNIALRGEIYAEYGEVDCFFNVGGNRSAIGENKEYGLWGLIFPQDPLMPFNDDSGLVEWYHDQGIPVLHFVDVKKLVKSVGLPYNPKEMSPIGTSSIYFEYVFSFGKMATSIVGIMIILKILFRRKKKQ